MLSDMRDYVESLKMADRVYMGKMDPKKEKSVGVYHSKHRREHKTAIGGDALRSYGTKYVTLLVHWNRSPGETEKAAVSLFNRLTGTREEKINDTTIKFILPLCDVQDVGTDDAGIYEMVIEAAVIFEKGRIENGKNESPDVCGTDGSLSMLRKPVSG